MRLSPLVLTFLVFFGFGANVWAWSSVASRTETDLKMLVVAVQSFRIDNNRYPRTKTWWKELQDGGYAELTQVALPRRRSGGAIR